MARFGTGINPQLGAIDYSPYMQGVAQGAQSIGQGYANLGAGIGQAAQGIGQAIAGYKEQKEATKKQEASIGSTLKTLESFEKLVPELGDYGQKLMPMIEQTKMALIDSKKSTSERFQVASQFKDEFASTLQLGQMAKQAQMEQATAQAKAAQEAQVTNWLKSQGVNMSPGAYGVVQNFQNIGSQIAKNNASMQPAPVDPLEVAQKQATLAKTQAETAALGAREQEKVVASQEQLVAKQKASEMFAADLDNTLFNTAQAKKLLREKGAGGTIEGLPGVGAISAAFGRPETQQLKSLYKSIASQLAVSKLQSMREVSTTGGSGLGNLTAKEWDGLANSIAELNEALPEDVQIEKLTQIQNRLQKLRFPSVDKSGAGGPRIISVKKL